MGTQPTDNSNDVSDEEYRDPESFEIEAQGHSFRFMPSGADRLAAVLEQIESATCSIYAFYYMFQDDDAGTKVRDALVDAARRGVDVRLIIDAFGSDAPDSFFDPLRGAGGHFALFSARWSVRYLIRNHQKFLIVDSERVLTGGFNISQTYFDPPSKNGWCDLGVLVEGDIVKRFVRWFVLVKAWVEENESQFRLLRRMVQNWNPGDGTVQLLVGGPLVRRGNWAWRFRQDIADAKRLDTVSAYFTPPRSIQRQFAQLARKGALRMITAGKSDMGATIDVARLHYKRLLNAGATIREFTATKLHMKLLVVDDICYFGSANLDKRSVRINVELMVRVEDAALADRLRDMIAHMEGASQHVTDEWYAKRATFFNRLRWRFLYWISLADYRTALKLNQ